MTYIGCSGWYYKEWKGIFYPPNLPQQNYFSYYATHFNTVEINNTFYHFPNQKTVQLWYQQTPKNFKYSIKASRYITHIKKFKDVQEPLKHIYGLSNTLDEKMGCFLFQFPRHFCFAKERLDQILSQLDTKQKNVIEFRHPSWWVPQVISALESANVIFCSVSGFDLPQEFIIINNCAYIRFHGVPAYRGSYLERALSEWIQQINKSHLKELWVYFNNTFHGYAVQNAFEFRKGLGTYNQL
ncbi:MAG: hypothetical protein BGO67_02685 [Alphaproteobacteria bacterium 41-28]|nr:MAG: hypothetical protein BGO67_02685 [Alphaproteobacteria bacterium 41-28]